MDDRVRLPTLLLQSLACFQCLKDEENALPVPRPRTLPAVPLAIRLEVQLHWCGL